MSEVAIRSNNRSRQVQVIVRDLRNLRRHFPDFVVPDDDVLLEDQVIAVGRFKIKSATLHKTDPVAAKVVRSDCQSIERFQRECKFVVEVLKKDYHPNLLKMLGLVYVREKCPHLLMELMAKSLTQFIQENAYYKDHSLYRPEIKLHIARDIANGLNSKYFHSRPNVAYIHCSLTCDNILLTEGLRAKISNFSRVRKEGEKFPKLTQNKELKHYLPPEFLDDSSIVSSKSADMYAFAKVVCFVATNTLPSSRSDLEVGYNEHLIAKVPTDDNIHKCLYTVAVTGILYQRKVEAFMSANEAFDCIHDELGPVVPPIRGVSKPFASNCSSVLSPSSGPSADAGSECKTSSTTSFEIPPRLRGSVQLTNNQLFLIALNHVHDWKMLAAALGMTDTKVKEIDDDNENTPQKKLAMLRQWHQQNATCATVEKLINAYHEVERLRDAQDVLSYLGTCTVEGSSIGSAHGASSLGNVSEEPDLPEFTDTLVEEPAQAYLPQLDHGQLFQFDEHEQFDQPPAQPGGTPPAEPPAQPGGTPPAEPPAQPGGTPPAEPPAQPGGTPPAEPPAQPGGTPPAEPPAQPAQPGGTPPAEPPAEPPAQPGGTPPAEPPAQSGGTPLRRGLFGKFIDLMTMTPERRQKHEEDHFNAGSDHSSDDEEDG